MISAASWDPCSSFGIDFGAEAAIGEELVEKFLVGGEFSFPYRPLELIFIKVIHAILPKFFLAIHRIQTVYFGGEIIQSCFVIFLFYAKYYTIVSEITGQDVLLTCYIL